MIFQLGRLEFSCPLNLKVSRNASRNVALLLLILFLTDLVATTSRGKVNSICFQYAALSFVQKRAIHDMSH